MTDFDCCAKPTREHALDEARWKLAQIRDATTWAEKPAVIVAAIAEIVGDAGATVASVKADAWDEGYWLGINGHTGPGNPYREHNQTGPASEPTA